MPEEATPEKHFKKSVVLIPAAIVAAALVGVWIYQAFDLSGARARKFADANRELNNELDAQLRSTDPHCCGWKPHWETSGLSTNPIDGTKTEFLTTESVTPMVQMQTHCTTRSCRCVSKTEGSAVGGLSELRSTYTAWSNQRAMGRTRKIPAPLCDSDLTRRSSSGRHGALPRTTRHYILPDTRSSFLVSLCSTKSWSWNSATTNRHLEP
jgi:hypothetical protein